MKLRVYFLDEYTLCNSLELIDYSDVYRELDKNRDVCWIYNLEQSSLTADQQEAINNDTNIKSWELIKGGNFPCSG